MALAAGARAAVSPIATNMTGSTASASRNERAAGA